ncbi:MAG: hypothetical protein R3C53_15075 [Pirellulaceae bacterium]
MANKPGPLQQGSQAGSQQGAGSQQTGAGAQQGAGAGSQQGAGAGAQHGAGAGSQQGATAHGSQQSLLRLHRLLSNPRNLPPRLPQGSQATSQPQLGAASQQLGAAPQQPRLKRPASAVETKQKLATSANPAKNLFDIRVTPQIDSTKLR